ncbi:MAG: AAA family ATPase [Cyanobacteria bacterium SID2]|nr:AAA family ATPase [Cyanobacteria bacterium SID2]MBP0004506.1 AAA family ATPase [Cyanobacteria bacterium SBC]
MGALSQAFAPKRQSQTHYPPDIVLPGYQVSTLLYESVNSLVYRGTRERDGLPVILKVLKSDRVTPTELARYQQEYYINQQLDLDGVVRAYALERYQNTVAIVLEDFGGRSLKDYLEEIGKFPLPEFLSIVVQIAEILDRIHAANIVHKDINPANILYNRELDRVKLIDFGISAQVIPDSVSSDRLPNVPSLRNSSVLEGTLPYMSPEQTGRMNCSLDYRTDFYSLGVTFYEMLLGCLPFDAADTMAWVHCHIAQTPTSPHRVDPDIPPAISDIVMKLLAKTAEERYQSAWGLQADLVLCLMQLEATGTIEDVIPGENDVVHQFRIPQRIYGREAELAQIHEAFERVGTFASVEQSSIVKSSTLSSESSPPEILFLAGDSGIGKTALVAESYKSISRPAGYLISGQFETDRTLTERPTNAREIPCSAVIEALRELFRLLLAETETQLAQWREKLLDALDLDDLVLVDAIPELRLVLGTVPSNPSVENLRDLGKDALAQKRFKSSIERLLRVFCYERCPLVLFLDNLQWADRDSLQVVETILSDPHSRSLLVVGAYRNDEEIEVIQQFKRRCAERGIRMQHQVLSPLPLNAIAQLVADTLQSEIKAVMSLAALIAQKTNGNPFFVREFLKTLHRERLLVFDDESMSWQWDIDLVSAQEITDNVLEVLLTQLRQLPENVRDILSIGACVGQEFDLDTIAELTGRTTRDLFQDLVPALVEGLVQPLHRWERWGDEEIAPISHVASPLPNQRSGERGVLLLGYQFLHEQVRQTAYDRVPSQRKAEIHLKIGQSLSQRQRIAQRPDGIVELARHWNLGKTAVKTDAERLERGRINLEAGRLSRDREDYTSALVYDLEGIEALPTPMWDVCPDLAFDLYLERTRSNLLQGNFDRMEDLVEILDRHAPDDLARAEVDRLVVMAFELRGCYDEALDRVGGSPSDARLSREVPTHRSDVLTLSNLDCDGAIALRNRLSDLDDIEVDPNSARDVGDVRQLGQAVELRSLYLGLLVPLYTFCDRTQFDRVAIDLLERGIQTQPTPATALACAAYSVRWLCRGGDLTTALAWASLAERFVERSIETSRGRSFALLPSVRCWVYEFLGRFVYPWSKPIPTALSLLEEAYRLGVEAGEVFGAGLALADRLLLSFYGGEPLNTLVEDAERWTRWCCKYQHQRALDTIASVMLPVSHLRERSLSTRPSQNEEEMTFSWKRLTETEFLDRLTSLARADCRALFYVHKAWALYLDERYGQALEFARLADTQMLRWGDGEIQAPSASQGFMAVALNRFILALCLAASYSPVDRDRSALVLQELESIQYQFDRWEATGPVLFQILAALVRGECYRLQEKRSQAVDQFDRAIELAAEADVVQYAAMGNELAAKFWLDRGKLKIAKVYFGEAYVAYQRWGAASKVQQLDDRYGSLLAVAAFVSSDDMALGRGNDPRTNTSINYTRSRAAVLDVTTVMQAAQALSGEIVLDRLLDKLMQLALANAGATRGVIILERNEQLTIEIVQTAVPQGSTTAESQWEDEETASSIDSLSSPSSLPIHSQPVDECNCIPKSTVHYVARTNESVVLNDATAESAFVNDPYIQHQQPKSLLCAPIQGQGKLIGILYLENDLTAGAFTKDRLDVLMLLCAQAAIALENARLYENLKQSELRERERATQLRESLQELQKAQLQLVQSEKMATLGQLVAGVAHEINNPVGFVDANLSHAQGYIEDLIGLLELYQETFPEPGEEIEDEVEDIDLDFILKDLPQILDSMKVGTERIRQISRSLRTFSRADTSAKVAVDIHEGIDSTLMILKPRLKFTDKRPAIEVVKEYGDLPQIECYAGQLNQVFMNIIANAIDALDDKSADRSFEEIEGDPNRIIIRTELNEAEDRARICIRDNGLGMTEAVRQHIFDHLFTTKAVGKGTGLGLSISYQIVVEKHGGELDCTSTPGEGTEFTIEIPTV